MSPFIKILTIFLWSLPILLGSLALVSHSRSLFLTFLVLLALYGAVWLWCRPSHFIVSPNYLEVVFPRWRRRIPMSDVAAIRLLDKETFRREFGCAMRIGVGGLWGGFGWLWTSRGGFLEFYISRLDGFVFIKRLTGNNLLITPSNSEQFMSTVREMLPSISC
jgi:hypothetical protein